MASGATKPVLAVWGSSDTDVFAVGLFGTILHYDGISWSAMTSGVDDYLKGIWGTSASDVYVVGNRDSTTGKNTVLHYDASTGKIEIQGVIPLELPTIVRT